MQARHVLALFQGGTQKTLSYDLTNWCTWLLTATVFNNCHVAWETHSVQHNSCLVSFLSSWLQSDCFSVVQVNCDWMDFQWNMSKHYWLRLYLPAIYVVSIKILQTVWYRSGTHKKHFFKTTASLSLNTLIFKIMSCLKLSKFIKAPPKNVQPCVVHGLESFLVVSNSKVSISWLFSFPSDFLAKPHTGIYSCTIFRHKHAHFYG